MRVIKSLAGALLLVSCSHFEQSPLPSAVSAGASPIRPASGPWLCGQTPSLQTREQNDESLNAGYQSLYKFKAQPDGASPYDGVIAINGKFYGTTEAGGKFGYGSVFEMSTSGHERAIYSFKGGKDGAYPCAGLTNVSGRLYGATPSGGALGWGTIFDVTTAGQEHVIYSFKAGKDGAAPYAGLLALNGKLYGTTVEGGTSRLGHGVRKHDLGPGAPDLQL